MNLFGNSLHWGISATLLVLCCSSVRAADPQDIVADSAVYALESILGQTNTLHAQVTQLVMDQDGRELQENQVELHMQKPARFSWAVTAPYEELMVTDGDTIWRFEPDLDQVTLQPFNEDLDRTPVMLLNSDAAGIAAAYEVSEAVMDNGNARFILQPRGAGSLFSRMSLTFAGADLLEMQFEDSLGQQTSLGFYDIERNQVLPASLFTFTPPEGVDIIDNTGE